MNRVDLKDIGGDTPLSGDERDFERGIIIGFVTGFLVCTLFAVGLLHNFGA